IHPRLLKYRYVDYPAGAGIRCQCQWRKARQSVLEFSPSSADGTLRKEKKNNQVSHRQQNPLTSFPIQCQRPATLKHQHHGHATDDDQLDENADWCDVQEAVRARGRVTDVRSVAGVQGGG
ncbi:hypothetical protein BaRGS_00015406, partial [Batillaria attramentaria]